MNKILSVVILTHNQPRELARLLGNLKTVPDEVEIIIVDDHSELSARDVVWDFRQATGTGQYEYLTEWVGCGGARNRGAKVAQGDWIWFVDGDDLIEPLSFGRILPVLRRTKKDVVLLNYEIRRTDGTFDVSDLECSRLKPWEVGIMAWFKVIRKRILTPFRERIMYEDNDWWMRQCLRCRAYDVVPGAPCYTYHQLAGGSATSVIERLKIPDGVDPASVKMLDWFLARNDAELTMAIAWLFEDLAALLKVRVDAVKFRMPESYFDALDYMIKYFKRMLRVR